jgi:hypothetical protein
MLSFKQPKYTKDPGTLQPVYEFPLEYTGQDIPIIDTEGFSAIDVLTTYLEHDDVAKKIMSQLIDTHKSLFAKQYTINQIMKITTQSIVKYNENIGSMWKCIPVNVTLSAGKFIINWELIAHEAPVIDLGDIPTSRPQSPVEGELIDVTNNLALEESSTDILRSQSQSRDDDIKRQVDKRKLHDARLRAKLALFRAERAAQKYIERYGDDFSSDSDLSDESDYS